MKLYHIIILSLITYLCEGYILWRYCSLLFVRKYSVKKCCVIYFVLYSISVIFSVLSIPAINSILFFLNTMLIIKLTYKVTWGKKSFSCYNCHIYDDYNRNAYIVACAKLQSYGL